MLWLTMSNIEIEMECLAKWQMNGELFAVVRLHGLGFTRTDQRYRCLVSSDFQFFHTNTLVRLYCIDCCPRIGSTHRLGWVEWLISNGRILIAYINNDYASFRLYRLRRQYAIGLWCLLFCLSVILCVITLVSPERLKLETVNFVCILYGASDNPPSPHSLPE